MTERTRTPVGPPTPPRLLRGAAPSSGRRLPGIEGVRAVAATSILVYHVWLYSSPDAPVTFGWATRLMPHLALGVTLFFTLSGFLLYRPFAAHVVRGAPRPRFRPYLRNRALRIAPAYWVILLVVALLFEAALVRTPNGGYATGSLALDDLGRALLLVQHYDPATVVTGIGPAWSLAVEVVFYVCLPGLVLLAWLLARNAAGRGGRRLAALAPAALVLAVGMIGKTTTRFVERGPAGGWGADWYTVLERSFLVHADLFAFGMALAVAHVDFEDGVLRPGGRARTAMLGVAGLVIAAVVAADGWRALDGSLHNTAVALACALLLASVVLPQAGTTRPRLVRVLETRAFVGLGLISYSVFLWHEPLVRWLHEHGWTFAGQRGFVLNVLIAFAVTVGLSVLTYRLVELPALRWKARSSHRPDSVEAAAAASASAAP